MEHETSAIDAYRILNVRPDAHQVVLRAAFHALAGLYHPDVDDSPEADARMAELNRAYRQVRTPEDRAAHDRQLVAAASSATSSAAVPASPTVPHVGAVTEPRPRRTESQRVGAEKSATIDFGRYDGWTLAQLAKHDPDYLRWLNRHTSGLRYRREIGERLAAGAAVATAPTKPATRRGWSRLGL